MTGAAASGQREEAASYLREKLVVFQKQIASLKHALREKEESQSASEKELLLQLLELADAFSALDEAEQRKAPDPARQKMVRQVRVMQKKLEHILKGRQVIPLQLEGQAQMELCEVVSTEPHPELRDETIVAILCRGYLHQTDGTVLRKAKVITVLNHQSEKKP